MGGVARADFERAALELWKLDRDCGRAPRFGLRGDGDVIPWEGTPVSYGVRLDYWRRALTVLRWAKVEADVPSNVLERAGFPGGCGAGYCRSEPRCPRGVCAAVC